MWVTCDSLPAVGWTHDPKISSRSSVPKDPELWTNSHCVQWIGTRLRKSAKEGHCDWLGLKGELSGCLEFHDVP